VNKPEKPRKGMDAEAYIDFVLSPMTRRKGFKPDWVLLQDGARPHQSAMTTEWCRRRRVKCVMGWPPRSPDINQQEIVWSILQYAVAQRGTVKSVEGLKALILEEWAKLDCSRIWRAWESRLVEVERLRGGTITGEHRLVANRRRYDLWVRSGV
jgi:hypothetical protein